MELTVSLIPVLQLLSFSGGAQGMPENSVFQVCERGARGCQCGVRRLPCNLHGYSGEETYFGCILDTHSAKCCPSGDGWWYNTDSFYADELPRLTCVKKTDPFDGRIIEIGPLKYCFEPGMDMVMCHTKFNSIIDRNITFFRHTCKMKSQRCNEKCFQTTKYCTSTDSCVPQDAYEDTCETDIKNNETTIPLNGNNVYEKNLTDNLNEINDRINISENEVDNVTETITNSAQMGSSPKDPGSSSVEVPLALIEVIGGCLLLTLASVLAMALIKRSRKHEEENLIVVEEMADYIEPRQDNVDSQFVDVSLD